jgi:hypothetical protein
VSEEQEAKRTEVTQTHIHPDCCAIEVAVNGHTIRIEGPTPELAMRLYQLYRDQKGGAE